MNSKNVYVAGIILILIGSLGIPISLSVGYGFSFDTALSYDDTVRISKWLWPVLLSLTTTFIVGSVLAIWGLISKKKK